MLPPRFVSTSVTSVAVSMLASRIALELSSFIAADGDGAILSVTSGSLRHSRWDCHGCDPLRTRHLTSHRAHT